MKSESTNIMRYASPNRQNIAELEKQLMELKQKEKKYLTMSKKVRQLQEKSKHIKKQTAATNQQAVDNDEIQYIKQQIEKTTLDSKKMQEDNKVVKQQVKSLQNQLRVLNEAHSTLCNQNKLQRQKIQLKDQQLVEKENQLQGLAEKRNCNQLVIQELRIDLSKLQGEEEELRRELDKIRMERMEEEKERERLRNVVQQLKNQIKEQEENGNDWKYRLSQVKEGNKIIKEELITLINLEDKLKEQLQKALINYQNITATQMQAQHKLKLLQDQLKIAEQDVKLLTDEYLKQSQNLRQQELQNQKLNGELDMVAKQIFSIWESVKQLIEINPSESSEVKIKCYQVWGQISKILDLQ